MEVRIKLIFGLAVVLLFCSLATLEFPELITLSDNTSNDFSVEVFGVSGIAPVAAKTTAPPQQALISEPLLSFFDDTDGHLGLASDSLHEKDCLRLFCIQRT